MSKGSKKGLNNGKTYGGFTLNQLAVIGVVAFFGLSIMGMGPYSDDVQDFFGVSGDEVTNNTQTYVTGDDSDVSSTTLKLDSSFDAISSNGFTLADTDNNYNDDLNTAKLQFDAERTDDGTNTTFEIKSKDASGTVQTLATRVVEGEVVDEPNTEFTAEVTVNVSESVIGGFDTTDQIKYSTTSASANSLTDDNGDTYYPISTGSEDRSVLYVDGDKYENKYSWTADSSSTTEQVRFDITWTGLDKMEDVSDEVEVPVKFSNGDDSPITVSIIKNQEI